MLVVGCANGEEAVAFEENGLEVVAVDLEIPPDTNRREFMFVHADAQHLSFNQSTFDYCYCAHVLEHIFEYRKAIRGMAETLKRNGMLYLATPNRNRLFAYVGSTFKHRPHRVVYHNLRDFADRLTGNFRLEKGAHCGFSLEELLQATTPLFLEIQILSEEYAIEMSKNSAFAPFVKMLMQLHILRRICISHVIFCQFPVPS